MENQHAKDQLKGMSEEEVKAKIASNISPSSMVVLFSIRA
jgi:hypothetical protein